MINYAHLDVLTVLMSGMGLDPRPVIDGQSPKEMARYRNRYTLTDSVYYLAGEYQRHGIPFDIVAERLLGIPKSTFYRRLKKDGVYIEAVVVVGNEYIDTLKFLTSGLKNAHAEFITTKKRLDEFVGEPPELRAVKYEEMPLDKEEPIEEGVKEDEGFTF